MLGSAFVMGSRFLSWKASACVAGSMTPRPPCCRGVHIVSHDAGGLKGHIKEATTCRSRLCQAAVGWNTHRTCHSLERARALTIVPLPRTERDRWEWIPRDFVILSRRCSKNSLMWASPVGTGKPRYVIKVSDVGSCQRMSCVLRAAARVASGNQPRGNATVLL